MADSAEGLVEQLIDRAADPVALDSLWAELGLAEQIPFRIADRAVFLYRGEADSVFVAGDHTGWQAHQGSALTRLDGTDLWLRIDTFPEAARIDYKLVVDSEYILDPANPTRQVSGFGPNSALVMPGWTRAPETIRQPNIPAGTITTHEISSPVLGMNLSFSAYLPAGYAGMDNLPVIYVTDGHEYADDEMGGAIIVLDNLIATGEIHPAIAVFIDPRIEGENRRTELYLANPGFAAFVAEELVPLIDSIYRTRAHREARVILGTSFGGVFSTYLGLKQPDTFRRLAIQSPAYWTSERSPDWPEARLADQIAESPEGIFTIYLSTGTLNDGEDGARLMHQRFLSMGHAVTYREVPQGHSWGNWRHLLPDLFRTLLPPTDRTAP